MREIRGRGRKSVQRKERNKTYKDQTLQGSGLERGSECGRDDNIKKIREK